jgi:bifunctional ADP-heptose synthase (sugar kinase/adenylyltransferase)
MGDILVVALTLDEFVHKGPGRPVNAWGDRMEILRSLRFVDEVVPSRNLAASIIAYRPHIVVKGRDWAEIGVFPEDEAAAAAVGAKIRFTTTEKLSSTAIIERIRCGSA